MGKSFCIDLRRTHVFCNPHRGSILQELMGAGMGKGPALSLPNMLVIGGVVGVKKTFTFCAIIVVLSTIAGMCYGWVIG